jgi:hypothetical protein
MQLASDLDNPEFVGARNPNEMLAVEFYDHAPIDKWETEKTGIKTYRKECPFVRISIPGNGLSTVERPAEVGDTKRFPREWLIYQMSKGGHENASADGWKLQDWEEMNPDLIRQLNYLRFFTVEQLAAANDIQIQGIGMGGQGLREKAKAAVAARNSKSANDEVAKRDAEIAELKAQMAQLMSVVNDKRGPGRPPKEKEAA